MRVLSSEAKKQLNKNVELAGWLHKERLLGGINFILLRDRAGLIQIKIEDKKELEKIRGLQVGTVLKVVGKIVADKRAPDGVEIQDVKLEVIVPVTQTPPIEIDKPLSHESEHLDTLFDHRVIGLRNLCEQAIFKIQASVKAAMREFFLQNDYVEFNSPKLLAGATEGGAEVFKLDYFGQEATLAQSAQFYKQIMVGVFERVFEINPTYRAEPSATTRHMSEFIHLDAEVAFVDPTELMQIAADLLNYIVDFVWKDQAAGLKLLGATKPKLVKKLPSLTLDRAHELYSATSKDKTIGEPDLRPDEERFVCEYAAKHYKSDAIFITDWPAADAKFYHRLDSKNSKIAERFDLIFRGVEISTGSMREHRYDALITQLKAKTGASPTHPGFKYYLEAFKYGMPPHGGFAMGLERLTQKIIGLSNVKEASLFPRDTQRLSP